MEETDRRVVASAGPDSAEAVPVLKPEVVEELLARLAKGEPVKRLATEYGFNRKTVRAWRARPVSAPSPTTAEVDLGSAEAVNRLPPDGAERSPRTERESWRRPSGDHSGRSLTEPPEVMRVRAPVATSTVQMSELVPLATVTAADFPSGE